MPDASTYRVLILGDFHYGLSLRRAGARIPGKHGYNVSTEYLRPFVDACDTFVLNLETPQAAEEEFPSSLRGDKTYVDRPDPEGSGALADLGVDAVSLANNHTGDLDHAALEATFKALASRNIAWFGAGRTRTEAEQPYRLSLPDRIGGGEISFYGGFEYSQSRDDKSHFYATDDSPGCAIISATTMVSPADHERRPDTLHVAFPHWGANYGWKSPGQGKIANRLTTAGYNLVIGHGSRNVQEVNRADDRWIVYGIGSHNFQSGGMSPRIEERNGILPFSFWTILEVTQHSDGDRHVAVKLYPVYVGDADSGFQPRPVASAEFDRLVEAVTERAEPPGSFPGQHVSLDQDALGHHIRLEVGVWPLGQAPSHSRSSADDSERNSGQASVEPKESERLPEAASTQVYASSRSTPNTYDDEGLVDLIRQNVDLGRNLGALMISRAAVQQGATLDWFGTGDVWATLPDRRVPIARHFGTESALAGGAVRDKALAKKLMAARGVSVPAGRQVSSEEDAVRAQEEIGRPVVVKPQQGSLGRGVTVNVADPADIRAGYRRARKSGPEVLVEQYIHGLEYRAHATPDECVAIFRRLLPSVTGDGHSTVAELVREKNELRKHNPTTRGQPIPMDDVAEGFLTRQDLNWDSVLSSGRTVIVRDVNGITSGGDSEECFDLVDDSVKQVAASAVAAIPGMDWGGVDLLIEEATGHPYVMEVNSSASSNGSTFPVYGTPRDVAALLWHRMYSRSAPEPTEPPTSLRPAKTPGRIAAHSSDSAMASLTLRNLLADELRRRGHRIVNHNATIWSAERRNEPTLWFNHVLSGKDAIIYVRPLRRRNQLRSIQEQMKVPRPRGRQVRNAGQLQAFREKVGSAVMLLPAVDRAGARHSMLIPANQPIDDAVLDDRSWIVQAHNTGSRFRVVATAVEALAAVAHAGQPVPDAETMRHASRLAVRAVRAVPQLRWAAVDVLVRSPEERSAGQAAALVETMSIRPSFAADDQVVAGSLDAVFDMLIAGAANSAPTNPATRETRTGTRQSGPEQTLRDRAVAGVHAIRRTAGRVRSRLR